MAGATQPSGSANESCDDWSSAAGSATGAFSFPDYDSFDTFEDPTPLACNTANPAPSLYCIEN